MVGVVVFWLVLEGDHRNDFVVVGLIFFLYHSCQTLCSHAAGEPLYVPFSMPSRFMTSSAVLSRHYKEMTSNRFNHAKHLICSQTTVFIIRNLKNQHLLQHPLLIPTWHVAHHFLLDLSTWKTYHLLSLIREVLKWSVMFLHQNLQISLQTLEWRVDFRKSQARLQQKQR